MRPGFACGRVSCCVKQTDPEGSPNPALVTVAPCSADTVNGPPARVKPCIRPAMFCRTNTLKDLVCDKGVPEIK